MIDFNRRQTKPPSLLEALGSGQASAFSFDPDPDPKVPLGQALLGNIAGLRRPGFTWGALGHPEDLLPQPLQEVAGPEVDVSGSRGPVRPAVPTLQRMSEPERPVFDDRRARRLALITAGAAGAAGLGALFGAPGLVHFADGVGGQTGRAAEQDAAERRRRLEAWRDGVRGVQAQNIATGNQERMLGYSADVADYRHGLDVEEAQRVEEARAQQAREAAEAQRLRDEQNDQRDAEQKRLDREAELARQRERLAAEALRSALDRASRERTAAADREAANARNLADIAAANARNAENNAENNANQYRIAQLPSRENVSYTAPAATSPPQRGRQQTTDNMGPRMSPDIYVADTRVLLRSGRINKAIIVQDLQRRAGNGELSDADIDRIMDDLDL